MDEEVTIPGFTKQALLNLTLSVIGHDKIIAEIVSRGVVFQRGTVNDFTGTPMHFELKAYVDTRVDV